MTPLEKMEARQQELEEEIAEAKKRLPAHSTKPPVMMMLLELEDEYDGVMKEIAKLKSGDHSGTGPA